MNIQTVTLDTALDRDDAEKALAVLRAWAASASPEEVADLDPAVARLLPQGEVSNYPTLSRQYPEDFRPDDAYRASMPDLQNGPASLIRGPSSIWSMWGFPISACRSAFTPATTAI